MESVHPRLCTAFPPQAGVPEPDNDQLSEVVGSKSKMREPLEEQVALGKSHEEVSDFELDIGVELAKKKKKHKKKKKKKPAQAIQMLERHLQTFMLNSFNQVTIITISSGTRMYTCVNVCVCVHVHKQDKVHAETLKMHNCYD